MKKSVRIVSLVISLVLIVCSLVGCVDLNEMRELQCFYNEDGSIEYNGNIYKALPYCKDLSPTKSKNIHVTEKDVPVLLSEMYGNLCYVSNDGLFIMDYTYGYGENTFCYCREDKYDEILARIEKGAALNGYCYVYYDYTIEQERVYEFSQREIDAINETLASEPLTVPSGTTVSWDDIIEVSRCSEDLLFKNRAFDLYIADGECSIIMYDDANELIFYAASEPNNAIFTEIFENLHNS